MNSMPLLPAGCAARSAGRKVALRFSWLLACLPQPGKAWEWVVDSWHVWLVWISWFARLLAAKGSQAMPVLSTVEVQLLLHKHKSRKSPRRLVVPQVQPISCTVSQIKLDGPPNVQIYSIILMLWYSDICSIAEFTHNSNPIRLCELQVNAIR